MNEVLDSSLFEAFARASDNIYIYVNDMKTNLSRWSASSVEYFGLEGEYFYGAKDKWLEHIHPDDRQLYIDDITAVFAGTSEHHNCQYRAKNRYGEYVWVECRGSVIRDEEGNPTMFAGMMTRIDNQSKYDSLTHLLNGHELFRKPFDIKGALMLVGIDNFRNINSQHGLLYGNKVLKYLSEVLSNHIENVTIYRFRGDEFAVYGENISASDLVEAFLKIRTICIAADNSEGIIGFSTTAGIVEFGNDKGDISRIWSHAELSLAYAKGKSTDHYAVYSSEIEEKHNRRNQVSEALNKSIKNNFEGFRLVYQPILANTGDAVVGCESLLRWKANDEEIDPCYPDEFISILEGNGGIIDVGYFVMQEAIRQAAAWQEKYEKFYVSFNVSYLQLEDPKFVPSIIENVKKYNLDTSCVVLELTESVLATDTVMVRNSFELLRKYGIKIALDDFGTGNSSFWTLHNINIDVVKLDQSFIRGLAEKGTNIDYAIVESVCLMCNRIGCMTIAEGVETEEILKMLSKFEFAGLQGFLFSRPVEVSKLEELLDQYNMKRSNKCEN